MKVKEAYSILGIEEGSDKETAKKTFRKLAAQYHPDNKNTGNEAKFKQINEAYSVIESGKASTREEQEAERGGGFGFDVGGINLNDLINGFGGFSSNSSRPRKRISASDITISQTLSFKETVIGATKEITYKHNVKCNPCNGQGEKTLDNGCSICKGTGKSRSQRGNTIFESPCSKCQGKLKYVNCEVCKSNGYINVESSLTINIPPGAVEGSVLNLGGRGNYVGDVFGGEQNTMLALKISVIPQKGLSLKDQNVFHEINISLLEALKGCSKIVPTIDGDKEIDIPKLFKNKEEIALPNLGVARKGKQIINVLVDYPKEIEKLIEAMEKQ